MATATAPRLINDNLVDLATGEPMFVFAGTGHGDDYLLAAVAEIDHGVGGVFLDVAEGNWGWSNRMKHCSQYGSGFGCDSEGDWHRHYSPDFGGEQVSVVTVRCSVPREAKRLLTR